MWLKSDNFIIVKKVTMDIDVIRARSAKDTPKARIECNYTPDNLNQNVYTNHFNDDLISLNETSPENEMLLDTGFHTGPNNQKIV